MSNRSIGAIGGILVVDDDPGLAHAVEEMLEEDGYTVYVAFSAEEAVTIQQHNRIYLAVLDLMMPLTDGITLMEELKEKDPELTVLIMTGFGTIETAVEAIKRGAEDYITKPFEPEAVRKKVNRLMEVFRLRREVATLQSSVDRWCPFESLVYVSPGMQRAVERARAAAESDIPVLLLGETGTGKGVMARAIHASSSRAAGAFRAINCGAVPHELVESEFFGHRKGAFTGAYIDSAGILVSANKGTVFFDEIGEMPKDAQVKLLRALEEKEVRPVGTSVAVPVDVRVISATNRTLAELKGGLLRDDFYFRLATVTVEIPPLRSRPEDVLVLAQHFTARASASYDRQISFGRGALNLLLQYPFPGNIRELENMVAALAALSHDDPQVISEKDVRSLLGTKKVGDVPEEVQRHVLALEQLERVAIERALRVADGNRTKAAALLGISRDTLYRKLRETPIAEQKAV